jgi:hypothetical protein
MLPHSASTPCHPRPAPVPFGAPASFDKLRMTIGKFGMTIGKLGMTIGKLK